MARPSVFDFLVALQRLENKTYMDVFRHINNIVVPIPRRKTYVKIDKMIADAEDVLQNDQDVEGFLARLSNRCDGKENNELL